ncbi:MAG: CHAT domain-containing protein [Pseudonocardiaceae bacterium]
MTAASAREGRVAAHELRADWTSERWDDLVSEPESESWLVALLTRRDPDLRTALVELLAGVDDFLRPMAQRLEALRLRRLRLVPQGWLRIVPFWAAPAFSSFTVCVQASAAVPAKRAAPGNLSEVLAVADPTGDLWAAAAEPETIRTHLERHSVTTRALVRTEAVKSAVLAAAATADVVHVAGHGRTDLTDPGRSALWLHDPAAHRAA